MITLIIGKYGAACMYFMMFLVTAEGFPTIYRGSVFGIVNCFARVGAIISPFAPDVLPG